MVKSGSDSWQVGRNFNGIWVRLNRNRFQRATNKEPKLDQVKNFGVGGVFFNFRIDHSVMEVVVNGMVEISVPVPC